MYTRSYSYYHFCAFKEHISINIIRCRNYLAITTYSFFDPFITYIVGYVHAYIVMRNIVSRVVKQSNMCQLGLCDNGKTYISIMLIMHYKFISITIVSYCDKIMIGYYGYNYFEFRNCSVYSGICMFCVVYNSIRKFTIITIINLLSLS